MDKYGEIREDLTPPEKDTKEAKADLSEHLSKRAAEQVSNKTEPAKKTESNK